MKTSPSKLHNNNKHTWNPVSRTPVSKDVVALAVSIIRCTFSGEASLSYNTVPSLTSKILGLTNRRERFSRTRDWIKGNESTTRQGQRKEPPFLQDAHRPLLPA